MFKEDIKIKIINEEHFCKVVDTLVKEDYHLDSIPLKVRDYLYAYTDRDVTYSMLDRSKNFDNHKNKEYVLHKNTLIPKEQANKLLTPCEQQGV